MIGVIGVCEKLANANNDTNTNIDFFIFFSPLKEVGLISLSKESLQNFTGPVLRSLVTRIAFRKQLFPIGTYICSIIGYYFAFIVGHGWHFGTYKCSIASSP